jgi:hypothetical protein
MVDLKEVINWVVLTFGVLVTATVLFLFRSSYKDRRRWRTVRGDVKGFRHWTLETALTHLSVIGIFFLWEFRESDWSGPITVLCISALVYVGFRQWYSRDPRWNAMVTEFLRNFPEANLEADFDTKYEPDGTLTLIPYPNTRSLLRAGQDIAIPLYGSETMLFIYEHRDYTDGQYAWRALFDVSLYEN